MHEESLGTRLDCHVSRLLACSKDSRSRRRAGAKRKISPRRTWTAGHGSSLDSFLKNTAVVFGVEYICIYIRMQALF